MKRKKGFYSISVVAKMFSVHQQTVRMYEKEGLITPKRSEGNTRLFSEEDVDRLEEIIYLTHKMGVNLAGVEIILKLKKRVSKMQDELNSLIQNAQSELDRDVQDYKQDVQRQANRLLVMKKENLRQIEKKHIDIEDVAVDIESEKRDSNNKNKKVERKAQSLQEMVEIGDKRDSSNNENEKLETKSNELDDWQIEYEDE